MKRVIEFDDENLESITNVIKLLNECKRREIVLNGIKKYFSVKELVCDHTYAKWEEQSWQFLDTDFLHALLIIRRDILQVPMTCNFSTSTQRGLRCNCCQVVQSKSKLGKNYLSSHILGKAGDFTVKGMTAAQARALIKKNADLLPCNIRLEDKVTWLHMDVLPQYGIEEKVYFFSA